MHEDEYIYAIGRIREIENSLLTKGDLETMLSFDSEPKCVRFLADRGWGKNEEGEDIVKQEEKKTWELIREIAPDPKEFDVLLYKNDFHNLKAIIKGIYKNTPFEDLLLHICTVDLSLIEQAVSKQEFELLPKFMSDAAKQAFDLLAHTGDSQLSDAILDRAALEAIKSGGQQSGSPFVQELTGLMCAAANIKTAFRALKTGKSEQFLSYALSECGTIDKELLMNAALEGPQAFADYITSTPFEKAVKFLNSPFELEKWLDNFIMQYVKKAKYEAFGVAPLFGFLLAKEREIMAVRIILSQKRNKLDSETVRVRLRDLYV